MKKRLGVFSFYNKKGRVGTYVDYLLDDLSKVLDRLIIVVNGQLDECGEKTLEKFTKEIVIRDNKGYDAGAYADILVNYLPLVELELYDELVLCNDTFYGPFTPFNEIFTRMDKEGKDFWGLNFVNRGFLSQVQSYFLVFAKKVLKSKEFWNFIRSINMYETNIKNVYGEFETKIYCCLKDKFTFGSYTDTQLLDVYESGISCVLLHDLPILKKKTFDTKYNSIEKQRGVLKLIYENLDYNVEYILEEIQESEGFRFDINSIDNLDVIKASELKYMCNLRIRKEEIFDWIDGNAFYIYGAGAIGREIYNSIFYDSCNMRGFVVSDNQNIENEEVFGYPVVKISEVRKNDKIVMGVNKLISDELQRSLSDENVLFIWENEEKTYVGR